MTESKRQQKGRIFISYRRADSAGYAGRIYDRLVAHFGESAIFMDVDVIEGGVDFVKVLEDAVQSCDVLIALMGRQWLNIKDKDGNRRLEDPEDFVRIEIATALKRGIRVIPVLVDGVDMPQPSELPENLKALTRRNALQVNHQSFNPDVYRLIEHTKSALSEAKALRVMKAQSLQVALKEVLSKFFASLKSIISKAKPFLRIAGFVGIVIVLFWFGSWGVPKIASFVPTAKASLIPTLSPSATFTLSHQPPTKMLTPNPTSTKTRVPVSTLTPTSLPTQITDAKGVSMVLVPSGKFSMGSEDGDSDESPAHTVYLDSFYMDVYEVTNDLYKSCVTAGVCDAPYVTYSAAHSIYYGNLEFNDYPVIYVAWDQAKTYCEWRNARLPTEAEWEKAARGTDGRTYPWGEGIKCSYANYGNCTGNDTTKVGSYEGEKSPYGIYDLSGNVWEWVNDWYNVEYYKNSPYENPLGPASGQTRVIRGGSWRDFDFDVRSANRSDLDPVLLRTNLLVGFRCAKNGTP